MQQTPKTSEQSAKSTGPLKGLRILDISSVIMGPFATQLLGDMGAEVILVEPQEGGSNRSLGSTAGKAHRDFSGIALNLLRNKRSLAINLKHPIARQAILSIAATCDVVITNLRTKPLERLGLSYADLRLARPDIIMCQAQGFRSDSVRADAPAYDDIIQAESGIVDCFIRAGHEPTLLPTIAADKICGVYVANAVMAAMLHRMRTGEGQRIEVPMLDVMRSFVLVEHGSQGVPVPPHGPAGYARILTSARRPQKTNDGWINILPYDPEHYDKLFSEGGLDHLIGDDRTRSKSQIIANSDFLYTQVQKITPTRSTEHWLNFCEASGIPVGKIGNLEEILSEYPIEIHPVAGSYRAIPHPVWFTGSPTTTHQPAQFPGQDSIAVLEEAGVPTEQIDALLRDGAIRATKAGSN